MRRAIWSWVVGGGAALVASQVGCSSGSLAVVLDGRDGGSALAPESARREGGAASTATESARSGATARSTSAVDTGSVNDTARTASSGGGTPASTAQADAGADATAPFDAGACPAPVVMADGIWHPYEVPARGTLLGPHIAASFCNVDAWVTALYDGVYLNLSINGDTLIGVERPAGGFDAVLDGVLQVGASPGVYRGTVSGGCGQLTFIYDAPLPPGLDCDAGTAPACPTGCAAAMLAGTSMWGPCEAVPTTEQYQVASAGRCESAPLAGSWTVDLASIEPYAGVDAGILGPGSYTAHGTVTVQMVRSDSDGGAEAATLSMTF